MAVVYKALDHRLNRYVAVKILKDELAVDEDFRHRFHTESQAVAMLSHSNIVAVYDVSRTSDVEYIVMELIEGITLKQYMQKRGVPDLEGSASFFIPDHESAQSCHSRGSCTAT
jgi:serine/threonine-protein kinase